MDKKIVNTVYDKLIGYREKIYPMHMPGHKLGRCSNLGQEAKIDVTEVEGTDNLHHPETMLLEAQEQAARTYGARKTYFLVNGSTSGILASIWATCQGGGSIVVARNAHKSVYNGIIMCRLTPLYIYPDIMENGIAAGIDPQQIRDYLEANQDIRAVILTSPNYEGMTSQIGIIAQIVHDYDKLLIVDEAHGAHLHFHDYFPTSALNMGADLVIQSTHKTLPAYTQSAMLHVNSDRVDFFALQEALSMFQSSSPSYVLMNGLDSCRALLDAQGEALFSSYVKGLKACRLRLGKELTYLRLLDESLIGSYHIAGMDCSKLVIDCSGTNITGVKLSKILRHSYHIQVELDGINHIIAMTSICDTLEGLEAFADALIAIDRQLKKTSHDYSGYGIIETVNSVYKPWDAYSMKKKSISLHEAAGQVVGEYVTPFPPGVPLIVPGERLTDGVIERIKEYQNNDIEIMGMADSTCQTIRIIDEV